MNRTRQKRKKLLEDLKKLLLEEKEDADKLREKDQKKKKFNTLETIIKRE